MFDLDKQMALCNKMLRAFCLLREDRFLAYGNFSCCARRGIAAMLEVANECPDNPQYYVFWSMEEEEVLRKYGYVYLTYGSFYDGANTDAHTEAVGDKIVVRLREQRADVEWDGAANTRILVKAEDAVFPPPPEKRLGVASINYRKGDEAYLIGAYALDWPSKALYRAIKEDGE